MTRLRVENTAREFRDHARQHQRVYELRERSRRKAEARASGHGQAIVDCFVARMRAAFVHRLGNRHIGDCRHVGGF